MTNSDSGTKLNPGDRVRVRHDTTHDGDFSARLRTDRAAMNGKEGTIRVRAIGVFGVEDVPGGPRAWFEADELEPIVTDPDGCEVVGPAVPLDVLDAAVQQALAAARREAQGWHSAALLARGETEGTRERLAEVEAERDALRGVCEAVVGPAVGVSAGALSASVRAAWSILKAEQAARYDALVCERAAHEETSKAADALRGKLGACHEARRDEAQALARGLEAVLREQIERKAAEAALAAERSIHETAALGADKLARQLDAVRAAWGKMRAFLLALPRPLGAAGIEGVDAVDKALGGVVVEPPLEQRVAEIEARLGRLESGK